MNNASFSKGLQGEMGARAQATAWAWLLGALAVLGLTQFPAAQSALEFNKAALAHGEVWRVVTGALTHPNLYQASLSVVALTLLVNLFGADTRWQDLAAFSALCLGVFTLEALRGHQAVAGGLSGPIHGFFAYGVLRCFGAPLAFSAMAALSFKLCADVNEVVPLADGQFAVSLFFDQHLWGAMLGTALGAGARCYEGCVSRSR